MERGPWGKWRKRRIEGGGGGVEGRLGCAPGGGA
jgi:hypothetical protein